MTSVVLRGLLVVVDLGLKTFLVLDLLMLQLLHYLQALLYVRLQVLQQLQIRLTQLKMLHRQHVHVHNNWHGIVYSMTASDWRLATYDMTASRVAELHLGLRTPTDTASHKSIPYHHHT